MTDPGCPNGSTARTQAGLFVFNQDNSSLDGSSFAISDPEQFVCYGPGLLAATATDSPVVQCWQLDSAADDGSLLDDTSNNSTDSYTVSCTGGASTSGYGNIGINKQMFFFGGTANPNQIWADEWSYIAPSGGDPAKLSFGSTSGLPYQQNGEGGLAAEHILHGSDLERAYIYVVGGRDALGAVTNVVEFGIW